MQTRRMAVLALGGALMLGGALWLALRPTLVTGVVVQAAPLVRTVQASGRVATLARVDVGATLTARVAQVRVQEGQRVRAGDALLELEADDARAALAQAQANWTQSQARVAGLRGSARQQALAALAQAQANQRAASADLSRTRQLVRQGFLSPARLDDAQRALAVAQASVDSASAQVQANADGGADLAQALAQQDVARAGVQAAQARVAQTVLRAPQDAVVLARSVEPGQIVQPGRALLALALAGPTQIKAQLDERFLAQLAPGQTAQVVADAYPGVVLAAHVRSLAPLVDAQRGSVEVTLTLDQPAPAFVREDMTLSVAIETARRARALLVPLAALQANAGTTAPTDHVSAQDAGAAADTAQVMGVVDGRAQLRSVRLGVRDQQAAEVLSGLAEGDTVLLGAATVRPGQRVRVQAAPSDSTAPGGVGSTPAPTPPRQTSAARTGDLGSTLGNAMGR